MKYDNSKRKPIKVNDPNDKRLIAYNDSLNLYNNSKLLESILLKKGYKPTGNDYYASIETDDKPKITGLYGESIKNIKKNPSIYNLKNEGTLKSVSDFIPGIINKDLPNQLYSETILPTKTKEYSRQIQNTDNIDSLYQLEGNNLVPYKRQGFLEKLLLTGRDVDNRVIADYSNVNPKQEVIYEPGIIKKPQPKKIDKKTSTTSYIRNLKAKEAEKHYSEKPKLGVDPITGKKIWMFDNYQPPEPGYPNGRNWKEYTEPTQVKGVVESENRPRLVQGTIEQEVRPPDNREFYTGNYGNPNINKGYYNEGNGNRKEFALGGELNNNMKYTKKKILWEGGETSPGSFGSNIDTSSPTLGGPGNSFGNPGGASKMNNPMGNPGAPGNTPSMTNQPGSQGTGIPQGGPPPTKYTDTLGTVNKSIGAATNAVSLADTIYETTKNKDPLYNQKLADSVEYNAEYKKNYDHYNKQRSDIKTANATMQTVGSIASFFGPIGALVGGVVSLAGGATNLAGNAAIDSAEKKAQRAAALKYGNSTLNGNEFNRNMQVTAYGGNINTPSMKANGGYMFPGNITHENAMSKGLPEPGIPVGDNNLVESGEYLKNINGKDYVFSRRLMYNG